MAEICDQPPPMQIMEPGSYARVAACINRSCDEREIVRHAFAIGHALSAPVTLIQVLEGDDATAPPDPLEWDIRRRHAHRALTQLATPSDAAKRKAEIAIHEGKASQEISRFLESNADSLVVMGMRAVSGYQLEIGRTLHELLYRSSAPILLVPPNPNGNSTKFPSYHKLFVPVDGSRWAASAVPMAARIAIATGAEIILAHVAPAPELTEAGPYDATDLELRERVIRRNMRSARRYLQRVQHDLAETGVRIRVLCVEGNDVRSRLGDMIRSEGADLVVLSPRGHGLSTTVDMPFGNVAGYLMTHAVVPLLLVPATAPARSRGQQENLPDLRLPLLVTA